MNNEIPFDLIQRINKLRTDDYNEAKKKADAEDAFLLSEFRRLIQSKINDIDYLNPVLLVPARVLFESGSLEEHILDELLSHRYKQKIDFDGKNYVFILNHPGLVKFFPDKPVQKKTDTLPVLNEIKLTYESQNQKLKQLEESLKINRELTDKVSVLEKENLRLSNSLSNINEANCSDNVLFEKKCREQVQSMENQMKKMVDKYSSQLEEAETKIKEMELALSDKEDLIHSITRVNSLKSQLNEINKIEKKQADDEKYSAMSRGKSVYSKSNITRPTTGKH